jgi:hypothetical protein
MGANSTQGLAVVLFFVSFIPLAQAFAGGGILALIGFLIFLGASIGLFLKCKPWEHQVPEGTTDMVKKTLVPEAK